MRQYFDFVLFAKNRLEHVKMIPLGATILEAINLYGEAMEKEPADKFADSMRYTFPIGRYHEAVIHELEGKIQSIVYWSLKADPQRDLHCVLERYKEDSQWHVMEQGYWYQRDDGKVRLWCSVAPAIGIAYVDYFRSEAEYKKSHCLEELQKIEDIHWAPSSTVFEMQRLFAEGDTAPLKDFADRSDKIKISPDGRDVFIIRNHRAYDYKDRFLVLNAPPGKDDEYSTQAISHFTQTENGSSWGYVTLPRNANVEFIRFERDEWLLKISRATDGHALNFNGSAKEIFSLSIGHQANGYRDDELWKNLDEKVAKKKE